MKQWMKTRLEALQQRRWVQAALPAIALVSTEAAMAAKTGTEFQKLTVMLKGWSEGYLGMALALAAFIIGLAVGLMKQTILPAIVGLGVALAAVMGPGIIMALFTATI